MTFKIVAPTYAYRPPKNIDAAVDAAVDGTTDYYASELNEALELSRNHRDFTRKLVKLLIAKDVFTAEELTDLLGIKVERDGSDAIDG